MILLWNSLENLSTLQRQLRKSARRNRLRTTVNGAKSKFVEDTIQMQIYEKIGMGQTKPDVMDPAVPIKVLQFKQGQKTPYSKRD
ncbi:hypothetical protein PGT21_012911 [Puccinia graminis f. sp. tritici]|uniref:Uncharacterized protein n=1 Tax=Puccinia graminis f. sp. tritici TaxID=56615 RepID=A0A5B0QF13_PUCGR|nr:hypothetical protein PGT21_012911 [Puccinia graminis f. sp. tritici]